MKLKIGLMVALLSGPLLAGECGTGKITAALDGGWDQDNYFIKLDNTNGTHHPGTYHVDGWIRFEHTRVGDSRYSGIKSMALAALVAGKTVRIYTHTNRCDSATEITIYP